MDDSPAGGNILSAVFLVGGVAVMLIVHILVVFWALRRGLGSSGGGASSRAGDEERAEDSCAGGGAGLTAIELGTLPCYNYNDAEDGGGGAGDCAVCLETFEAGDRCRRLPRCEHCFHAACVESWLRKSRLCPVCRTDAVDRSPRKGEAKAATTGEAAAAQVEMVERRRLAALEAGAGGGR
ncbi:hypothetical protein PR202_ga17216 [Eleusine coracana subsp. coracana]|uniref:RING-type domain-containing protein n=1 Tax=Eleusine coracana subsp. coracana TaxID=191504 RepID=A0AAV5CNJ4_ELECO|nr:hypothetical protein PR202_ga17216 [Eleusine coracana subsp. coracana]